MYEYESALYDEGYRHIAGVDESGRGPLAGPVMACAVILPKGLIIEGVKDSKQLSPKRREALYEKILNDAVSYGIGVVGADEIDRINILMATMEAMRQAVAALSPQPDAVIVDGNRLPDLPTGVCAKCIIKGDELCHTIAAASIIAKVTRDHFMGDLHEKYPLYGFRQHKGYGTKQHVEAIRQHGVCAFHRKSFKVRALSHESPSPFI